MTNLHLWDKFADIDPKFTKAITGKPYRGTSPNPQYVIRCLTEMFGPVGQGFGWRVVSESFTPLGDEVLHWCRIEFWHTVRENTFESYGQTKAAYQTRNSGFMVDEDAPKKSLTDAIIKAASQLGIAANIFLGRWDDQKYVAEVNAEYRAEERQEPPKQDAPPQFDPVAAHDRIVRLLENATTYEQFCDIWSNNKDTVLQIGEVRKDLGKSCYETRDKRKVALRLADGSNGATQ